jgi:hypothetical protein
LGSRGNSAARYGNLAQLAEHMVVLTNLNIELIMDTKLIGNITELEVLTYVTKLGYQVSIPFGDRERYDQIWDINGKLIKVQVKTSHSIDEDNLAIKFSCRSSQRRDGKSIHTLYKKGEIDYFATMWDGQCYLVPVEETSTQKVLRLSPSRNCQVKGISFADSYKVEEVLKNI